MAPTMGDTPLFAGFDAGEVALVEGVARRSVLSEGQAAFEEGDRGDSLIVLNLGTLQLAKTGSSGDPQVITTLGTGDYLGELSLLDQAKRSLSGIALERCEISIIPFADLLPLLDKHPVLAAKFYRNVALGIARRLRHTSQDIAFLRGYLQRGKER
jgi:CRP/FNR family transcriptional regulator, cyclic AMP receptor protein